MTRRPGYGRALLVAVIALALDQLTKALVRGGLSAGERSDLLPGIDLVRVGNRGIAFGLLDDAGSFVLVLAAVAFASLLAVFLTASDRRGLWLPIGLLAGGAVGNLIDRIRPGGRHRFHRHRTVAGVQPRRCRDHRRSRDPRLDLRVRRDRRARSEAGIHRAGAAGPGVGLSADRPLVVWSDESLAIVDKPAGLLVHPAPGNPGPSLVEELGPLLGGGDGPGPARDRPPARP